jgi:hypothetical protein
MEFVRYLNDGANAFRESNGQRSNAEDKRTIEEVNQISKNLNNGDGGNGKRILHSGGDRLWASSVTEFLNNMLLSVIRRYNSLKSAELRDFYMNQKAKDNVDVKPPPKAF